MLISDDMRANTFVMVGNDAGTYFNEFMKAFPRKNTNDSQLFFDLWEEDVKRECDKIEDWIYHLKLNLTEHFQDMLLDAECANDWSSGSMSALNDMVSDYKNYLLRIKWLQYLRDEFRKILLNLEGDCNEFRANKRECA